MFLIIVFIAGVFCGMYVQRSRAAQAARPPIPTPPPMRDVTDYEVEELLRKGRKLEAIKRYREIYRCDIATAQARVDTLEAILKL